MTTNLLQKLLDNGILQYGIWETIYMTLLSTISHMLSDFL